MIYLLHQILSESAAKYADRKAVLYKDHAITYAELERESNRFAQGLRRIGTGQGERVGIFLNRSIDSIVSVFGTLKAGAAYVPIDPMCPPARLKYIIDKCRLKLLVTSHNKLDKIASAFPMPPSAAVLVMDGKQAAPSWPGPLPAVAWPQIRTQLSDEAPNVDAIDRDIAYILFTSGSTGNPKGVMLSHLNALTFIKSAHAFFKISADDRVSNICPLHFDMSVFDLYVTFTAGAALVVIPETDALFPSRMARDIAAHRITVWNSVPSALCLLSAFKDLDSYDFAALRLVLFAGEIFPLKHLHRLQETFRNARFCNLYGQTEANSSMYYWAERLPPDPNAILPIGKTLPNFEVFALTREGRRVSEPGQEGELYVRASTVACGYLDEPGKTRHAFVPDPLRPESPGPVYKTGDLVRLDGNGDFVFMGRKDHMIKSRGYRIEIGEIEAVLRNHAQIENAVVIPVPDELVGNRISALIVPAPQSGIQKRQVLTYCSKFLPKYMIPEIIQFCDALPQTASGKIDRNKLARTNSPAAV